MDKEWAEWKLGATKGFFSFLQKLISGTEPSIKIKVGFPQISNFCFTNPVVNVKICPLKQNIYEKREAKLATKDRQRNWKQIVKTNFQFFIPCLHLYTIMYSIMQWICIHFLRIRIQLFISMRIRQPFKSGFGSSITKFITNYKELKKTTNIYQKLKTMELVYIKLIFSNKITISTNFPAFFPLKNYECGSTALVASFLSILARSCSQMLGSISVFLANLLC